MHIDIPIYIYLFHHEQAGQNSQCFNARCGYVHLRPDIPVDMVIDPVSTYGANQIIITLSIYQVSTKLFSLFSCWN